MDPNYPMENHNFFTKFSYWIYQPGFKKCNKSKHWLLNRAPLQVIKFWDDCKSALAVEAFLLWIQRQSFCSHNIYKGMQMERNHNWLCCHIQKINNGSRSLSWFGWSLNCVNFFYLASNIFNIKTKKNSPIKPQFFKQLLIKEILSKVL